MNRRSSLLYLALITLVASGLACNAPTPTPVIPPGPPPTVTSNAAPTSPAQETPPTQAPPETTLTPESPQVTEMATATAETASPTATTQPQAATSTPTETPTLPPSAGPLDFVPPTWVQSWESLGNDQYRVVAGVHIIGGAPPFIIEHDHVATDDSPTQERDYNLVIITGGCGAIVHNITVKSADGQEVSKDYYIGGDPQPWCNK